MRVLVVREYVPEDVLSGRVEGDLRFLMIAKTDTMNMVSPVVGIEGRGCSCNGHPYLVYGDACADFTGLDKLDLNITVAECTIGNLEGWS